MNSETTKPQAIKYLEGKIKLYQNEIESQKIQIEESKAEILVYESQIEVLKSVVKLVTDGGVAPGFVVVEKEKKVEEVKHDIVDESQTTPVGEVSYDISNIKTKILEFVKSSPPIGTKEIHEGLKIQLPLLELATVTKLVSSFLDNKKLISVKRGLYQTNVVAEEEKKDTRPQFLATNYKYEGGKIMCVGDYVKLRPSTCVKDSDILEFPEEKFLEQEGYIVESTPGSNVLLTQFETKLLLYPHWLEFVRRKDKVENK